VNRGRDEANESPLFESTFAPAMANALMEYLVSKKLNGTAWTLADESASVKAIKTVFMISTPGIQVSKGRRATLRT